MDNQEPAESISALENLKQIFYLSSEYVVILNQDSEIIWSNKAVETKHPQLNGVSGLDLLKENGATDIQWPPITDRPIRRKINQELMEYIVTTIDDQHWLIIIRDLDRLKTELEKKIQDSLNAFAHDILRTPLNSIIGFTDLALENPHNEDLPLYLNKVFESANKMLKNIDSFLNITSLAEGMTKIKKEKFDIFTFTNKNRENVEMSFKKEEIKLIRKIQGENINFEISADKEKVNIAISNLLNNAAEAIIAANAPLDKRKIIMTFARTETGMIKIIISNYTNISHEDAKKIFTERFSTKFGGGFGTGAVKAIIEAHNGQVSAKLAENEMEITIVLPV